MNIIELKKIEKEYASTDKDHSVSVRAVDGVDLIIEEGEYVAIVGPSGSGKSTLMQILGLLDSPTGGTYNFLGKDVSSLSEDELAQIRSQHIGFVFQFFNLLARTSTVDNVSLPLIYSGKRDNQKAISLLNQVGLSERLYHKPHQLSGGQQQRVAIARALINDPQVIFADEPTGNINQQQAEEIMNHLASLHNSGVTVILVTHSPDVAARADRIIEIVDGKIISDTRKNKKPSSKDLLDSSSTQSDTTEHDKSKKYIDTPIIKENVLMALNALVVNKLRTFLSTLGITIGVSAVIALMALGQGAQDSIQSELESLGTNLVETLSGNPARRAGRKNTRFNRLRMIDANAISSLKKLGVPIVGISPELHGPSVQTSYANKDWTTSVEGVTPEYQSVRSVKPAKGRFFTEEEDRTKARVCLIGNTIYTNLFPPGFNPIGSTIKINRINFTVIGILPIRGGGWKDNDDIVLIPLRTAMYRVLGRDHLTLISVKAEDSESTFLVSTAIQHALRKLRKISNPDDDNFHVRNSVEMQKAVSSSLNTLKLLLASIAMISLLVGGVGIMNIMLVSVKERTREIGLRKALGAKRRDILLQFLVEATLIGLIGGCLGIFFGYVISFAAYLIFGWQTSVSIISIMVSFIFSCVVAIVFGFWPARQASRLSPIEALRYE